MVIFLVFYVLIVLATIIGVMLSVGKPNKDVLFGVTLPYRVLDNDDIKSYQREYKKICKVYFLSAVILSIPMFFIDKYFSIQFNYMILWTFALVLTMEIPYIKMNKKLKGLKEENGWFVGQKRIAAVDTTVSKLKNSSAVSSIWFIVPLFISLISIFTYIKNRDSLLIAVLSPIMVLSLFLINWGFMKIKSKVYSENTEINLGINAQYKRLWSIFWFLSSICNSLIMLFIQSQINDVRRINSYLFFVVIVFLSLIDILTLIYISIKIKRTQRKLLSMDDRPIYTDDDEYWINGILYCNQNDKSVMVEKRMGIGLTINIGNKVGKALYYGAFVLIALTVLPLSFFTVYSDFKVPSMEFSDSKVVKINSFPYSYSFNISDVEDIKLIDKLPKSIKTNGAATNMYLRGNFNSDAYGKTKMYVFRDNEPYILIKLKGLYIIYNERDRDKTKEYYDTLLHLK